MRTMTPSSVRATGPLTGYAAGFACSTISVGSGLRLLGRGRAFFGSYAKILLRDGEPAVFAQFGPLSAYPRAQRIRELYPRLPSSPLLAVITYIASTSAARGDGLGRRLVEAVVDDLADRGFAAVEAYPDPTLEPKRYRRRRPPSGSAAGSRWPPPMSDTR